MIVNIIGDNLIFLMIIPAVLILVLLILIVKYCVQKCKNARQNVKLVSEKEKVNERPESVKEM